MTYVYTNEFNIGSVGGGEYKNVDDIAFGVTFKTPPAVWLIGTQCGVYMTYETHEVTTTKASFGIRNLMSGPYEFKAKVLAIGVLV